MFCRLCMYNIYNMKLKEFALKRKSQKQKKRNAILTIIRFCFEYHLCLNFLTRMSENISVSILDSFLLHKRERVIDWVIWRTSYVLTRILKNISVYSPDSFLLQERIRQHLTIYNSESNCSPLIHHLKNSVYNCLFYSFKTIAVDTLCRYQQQSTDLKNYKNYG